MEKSSQFRAVVRAAFPVHSLQVRFDGVEAEAHAACDLRAGAAMVIAGLVAEGTTTISDIKYVERGYENITEKFRALGADFQKVETPEPRLTVVTAG